VDSIVVDLGEDDGGAFDGLRVDGWEDHVGG